MQPLEMIRIINAVGVAIYAHTHHRETRTVFFAEKLSVLLFLPLTEEAHTQFMFERTIFQQIISRLWRFNIFFLGIGEAPYSKGIWTNAPKI